MAKSLEERVLAFNEEMKKLDDYKVRYVEGATVIITKYMVTFLRGNADNLINNLPCPKWEEPEQLISRRKVEDTKDMCSLLGITLKRIAQAPDVAEGVCCMWDVQSNISFPVDFSRYDRGFRYAVYDIKDTNCQKTFLSEVVRLFPKAHFTCNGAKELIHWFDLATGSDGFICPYFIRKGGLA